MKKILLFVFLLFYSLIQTSVKADSIFFGANWQESATYYEISVEEIFPKEDKEKFDAAFKNMSAPFEISFADYSNKLITVKMLRKVEFDDVKSAFDKVGLRVIKEKMIKK